LACVIEITVRSLDVDALAFLYEWPIIMGSGSSSHPCGCCMSFFLSWQHAVGWRLGCGGKYVARPQRGVSEEFNLDNGGSPRYGSVESSAKR